MNTYKKFVFFMLTFILILYTYINYFKYNDKITYFNTDITSDISNSLNIVNLLKEKGLVKDPNKNFNNSSCKLFNFYDISNNFNIFFEKYYNDDFLNKIKSLINQDKLYFLDPLLDPLSFTIQLYTDNDFMSYDYKKIYFI